MIESIVLKNRTSKTIKAFKLGWIIMSAEDHRAGKNREAALLEGGTDLIEPGFTNFGGRTKPFYLEVLKAAKPLVKDGTLNGTFAIRIRLTEVQFQDGSIWIEGQPVARRAKYSHRNRAGPVQLPSDRCENSQCNFHGNGQGYCGEVNLAGYHCGRHDFTYEGNSQDPAAWYCDSYVCSECQDKDNDGWYDCENDCDDSNNVFGFATNPNADEMCDGRDNNCNGLIDEDCETCYANQSCPTGTNWNDTLCCCYSNTTANCIAGPTPHAYANTNGNADATMRRLLLPL